MFTHRDAWRGLRAGKEAMLLAESHHHGYTGVDAWPILSAVVVVGLVAVLVAVLLLPKRPHPPDDLRQEGGQPTTPPAAQPPLSAPSPAQQAAAMGDYLYCEDTILDVLRQKGRPMMQKEVCEDTGLPEQEVAGALAFMEERGMVKRTWDRSQSTYRVEAT